jgi:hypothetical protein
MIKKLIVLSSLLTASLMEACCVPTCVPDCIQPGPNRLQPAPVLTSATNVNGVITVNGSLSTIRRNATYIIQFFGNPTNRNPITEGDNFLGQITVTTDCFGNAPFMAVLLPPTQNTDPFISATATFVTCGGQTSDTSEFSSNIPVAIS